MSEKIIRIYISIIVLTASLTITGNVHAAIPNNLFSNHMVLQQNVSIPVWGTGREHEQIQVEFNGQVVHTEVKNNKWNVIFPPMSAGGPYTMDIIGDTTVSIHDIYIGEVWVCSGQSNMARRMSTHFKYQTITNYEEEKAAANYPLIRQFTVADSKSDTLVENANGRWTVCQPDSIEQFSAVAYFFAKDLHISRNVPIGIILSAVGGTQAKYWTSREGLSNNPELKKLVKAYDDAVKEYPELLAKYTSSKDSLLKQYEREKELAKKKSLPLPRKPRPPHNPSERWRVSCFFNGMIAPLIRYPIKGVAWYQGESDRDFAEQYRVLFPTLIDDWRKHWNNHDLPFLFVQIAPYKDNNPEIREAQLLTLQNTKNTAMIVTTDCGDANDIHPPHKQPVGYRLSLAARSIAYNEDVAFSGPVFDEIIINKNNVHVHFTHVYGGLKGIGDELTGFTIADSTKKFVPAKAYIKQREVIVYNDSINNPVFVRYGWANVPDGNLYNNEDLPASPFRSDIIEKQ